MPSIKQSTLNQNSTSGYASLLRAKITGRTAATITIANNDGANGILWKVMVSNDPEGATGTFAEDKVEDSLAAGGSSKHVVTGAFAWVDVMFKDESSGNHAACSAWLQAVGV
jgi:hypothetical protein